MLKTKTGESIEIDDFFINQIKENISNDRYIFEKTPIGKKQNGTYFWWDEEENPELDADSVESLILKIN